MPPLVIPRMIQSFYSYYVLDLGKSSFILSFPASWVFIRWISSDFQSFTLIILFVPNLFPILPLITELSQFSLLSPHFTNSLRGHVFPFRYPYDWQTPCGYLATSVYLMFQMSCNNTIHFNCCFLFYSICQFVIAFIADFRLSLSRLDAEFRGSTPLGSHCSSADGIRFHTDLKQLMRLTSITN